MCCNKTKEKERAILKIDYFIFNMVVLRIGENEYAVHTLFKQLSDNLQSFVQLYSDGFTITIGKIYNNKEEMNKTMKVFKKIFIYSSIIIGFIITKISVCTIIISFKDPNLIKLSFEILPFLILTSILTTIASYYFSYLRGTRQFKFLALRNLISSILKIILPIGLSFTILGIFGV